MDDPKIKQVDGKLEVYAVIEVNIPCNTFEEVNEAIHNVKSFQELSPKADSVEQ